MSIYPKINIPKGVLNFKYTYGKEYVLENKEYVGYYYELGGEAYAGKEFSATAAKLIKTLSSDNLSLNTYEAISGKRLPQNINVVPYIYKYETDTRYFSYHQITKNIVEIDENAFKALKSNPIYTVVSLKFYGGFIEGEVLEAENQIPGIKNFTDNIYIPPTSFNNGDDGFDFPEGYVFDEIRDRID
jgi:hypothetical protein